MILRLVLTRGGWALAEGGTGGVEERAVDITSALGGAVSRVLERLDCEVKTSIGADEGEHSLVDLIHDLLADVLRRQLENEFKDSSFVAFLGKHAECMNSGASYSPCYILCEYAELRHDRGVV